MWLKYLVSWNWRQFCIGKDYLSGWDMDFYSDTSANYCFWGRGLIMSRGAKMKKILQNMVTFRTFFRKNTLLGAIDVLRNGLGWTLP